MSHWFEPAAMVDFQSNFVALRAYLESLRE